MLRFLIFAVVFVTLIVFARLLLLSLSARPQRREATAAPTIEAKPRFQSPMTVRKYEFKRFDAQTGPADPENFSERLTLHAAPEGTDDIAIYSVIVATPRALAQRVGAAAYAFQRNTLIVPRYDLALIERALHEHVNEIIYLSGEDA
jgi:hypothetical protein